MSIRNYVPLLPEPLERYDPENERTFRREVERVMQDLKTAIEGPTAARLELTSDQNIPTGVITDVDWDTADFDTATMWNSTTNPDRLVIRDPGIYLFCATAVWADLGGITEVRLDIYRNGLSLPRARASQDNAGTEVSLTATVVERADRGDFYTAACWQASGVGVNVLASAGRTNFSAVRIG